MTHPGHPAIDATDKVSESRDGLNKALYSVDSVSAALTSETTLDVTTHGTHILCDASGGVFTVHLPDPTDTTDDTHANARFVVKKIDSSANAVTLDTTGTPNIDGAASVSLAAQWDTYVVWAAPDGEWYVESSM